MLDTNERRTEHPQAVLSRKPKPVSVQRSITMLFPYQIPHRLCSLTVHGHFVGIDPTGSMPNRFQIERIVRLVAQIDLCSSRGQLAVAVHSMDIGHSIECSPLDQIADRGKATLRYSTAMFSVLCLVFGSRFSAPVHPNDEP